MLRNRVEAGARRRPAKETLGDASSEPSPSTVFLIAAVVINATLCLCMCGVRACAARCMLPDQCSGTATLTRRRTRRRITGYVEHTDEEEPWQRCGPPGKAKGGRTASQ